MKNHYNCIYMYINITNNKKYVGQAKDFNKRHKQHIRKYTNSFPIDKAFNKYGEENFEIIILKEDLQTQCLLNFWECYYIEKYNCLSKENYNCSSGGSNGNNFAGKTEEEMNEIRNKISEKSKLMWENMSKEDKMNRNEKLSKSNMGKQHSEETKEKISHTRKERKVADGENNGMYGKHHSEETKRKISEAKKGKYSGEQHYMYGKHHSEETKEKMRKPKSEEAKRKMSESKSKKPIAQYNKNGELIKIWQNSIIAGKELSIDSGDIRKCCKFYEMNCDINEWMKHYKKRPTKSVGGFIWKYKED